MICQSFHAEEVSGVILFSMIRNLNLPAIYLYSYSVHACNRNYCIIKCKLNAITLLNVSEDKKEKTATWYFAYARLGQGWGKVMERSGLKARFGQGLGRQGRGEVRARSGQKARLGQGLGKLAVSQLLSLPQFWPSPDIAFCPDLAPTLPRPCPNLARTLPGPCPDLAPTLPRPCPNLARTLPLTCPDLARTVPLTCPDLAPTLRRRSIKLPEKTN